MKQKLNTAFLGAAFGALLAASFAVPAGAAGIIDEWANAKAPDAPQLKPVTVDPKTTALLLLDFVGAQDPTKGPCNANNTRCIASIPKMKALLDRARAAGATVAYSIIPPPAVTKDDIATALAPKGDEPVVRSGPDKYVGTDLKKILDAKGIKTVIVTGTVAQGAVLDTATDAALQGLNVIVPVDGMSSATLYPEQYVAWHLVNAPGVSAKTTLTSSDQIKF